uniref:protein-tyrosine-phosphatase n=1 Tax=Panagrellus redivivus TaxID=6233 RepID=A0A7E4V753_PANRE
MELEHNSSRSFTPSDVASTSDFADLATVNVEQLAEILQEQSYDSIVLDCRPPGAVPTIHGAQPIFLPTVLLRRLNNGTISPSSISPMLVTTNRRVVIVPDSMQPNSLATRVFNTLVRREYSVAFLNQDVKELANLNPELCTDNLPVNVMKGLNLNILTALNKKSNKNSNVVMDFETVPDENRHRRPNALFPVQILSYLFLGNDETAKNKDTLKRYNIRYVINVTKNLSNYFKDDPEFHYLRIGVDDTGSHNLIEHFPTAIQFIERAKEDNSAVLVHCMAGISRSVTICLAYLMQHTHSTLEQSFDFLLKQNGAIAPNFHFMGQLIDFERSLFDTTGSSSSTSSSLPPSSSTSATSAEMSV